MQKHCTGRAGRACHKRVDQSLQPESKPRVPSKLLAIYEEKTPWLWVKTKGTVLGMVTACCLLQRLLGFLVWGIG